jgi:DnaJ-class molecular chaperone
MAWIDYSNDSCPKHGYVSGSVYRCDACGGEGETNEFDSDPLWYGTYDEAWEPCDLCDGKGFWWVCAKEATP